MADVSGKDLGTAERRMASIVHHLLPLPPPRLPPIRRSVTSANDNYRRVHREVSTREAPWIPACDESGKEYTDTIYEKAVGEGIAKFRSCSHISINHPERRNAFRPNTIKELICAIWDDNTIGVIILRGKGNEAFCSGGDQALRSSDGYADSESFGHLNVLDLQVQIRRLPKLVIAMVAAGYAVGGGHILHMVCDFYYCF
ncbi:unnamed protein product [Musa acuminata subsp. malaccensis]|uniref:(wild Malaysian banana) hypothetical protein n=1 Tax=Musa acuminata subsp. malaccensis TaxID=214687 RepID=A0A804IM87_MUSAM|nr:unnamed protein product [Musa acuminata subsp. malaccensis]